MHQRPLVRTLLLAAAACAGLSSPAAQAAKSSPSMPAIRSSAFYVLDETNSAVVLSRHSNVARPIASITKLMTALVVLEAGQSLDDKIKVRREDKWFPSEAESRLPAGTVLTRGDLMHLALMSSENRAAYALCANYEGGLPACVQAMNSKAAALGMKSAHFVEPTGLSSRNVASSEDLAKLVMAASENPTIQQYSTDDSHIVPIGREKYEFRNTNSLVRNPDWDIVVQKTGYISEAGRCLVMKTVFDGRSIVIVLLDSVGKLTRVADAKRIRKWMEAQVAKTST
ncbi:MAG: serine hydrolase [Gammaproteobacteria bacterium]|nr:serine hydrolase [Gammaproteobacteria bacterium]